MKAFHFELDMIIFSTEWFKSYAHFYPKKLHKKYSMFQ